MAFINGQIGQIKGPFSSGSNILNNNLLTGKFGISIGEKDLMKIKDFKFRINNVEYLMGRTGIYEICEPYEVSSIEFPEGAPASVVIDYININI